MEKQTIISGIVAATIGLAGCGSNQNQTGPTSEPTPTRETINKMPRVDVYELGELPDYMNLNNLHDSIITSMGGSLEDDEYILETTKQVILTLSSSDSLVCSIKSFTYTKLDPTETNNSTAIILSYSVGDESYTILYWDGLGIKIEGMTKEQNSMLYEGNEKTYAITDDSYRLFQTFCSAGNVVTRVDTIYGRDGSQQQVTPQGNQANAIGAKEF